jgi:hypothetical protein
MSAKPTSKTFGKSTREVPASSEKAKKWYPADDDAENEKVRKAVRSWTPRGRTSSTPSVFLSFTTQPKSTSQESHNVGAHEQDLRKVDPRGPCLFGEG